MTEIPAKETASPVRKVTPVYIIDPSTQLPTGSFGGGGGGTAGGTATAAAPTYTEGATGQALSVNLKGGLRVVAVNPDGTDVDPTVPALVEGGVASGSAVGSAKPLMTGGRAATALPAAVADGQAVRAMLDKYGRLIARAVLEESLGTQTATVTAGPTAIVSAVASVKNRLYGLVLANTNTSNAVTAVLKDDTTTRSTFQIPAGETRGFMLPPDAGFPQAAVNKDWTLTVTGTSPNVVATALFVATA